MPTLPNNEGPFSLIERNFGGMVTTSPRQAIGSENFAWLENVIPMGPGNLSVVPGKTSVASVSGETINSFDSVTISGVPFLIAGTSLGNVYAWRTDTWAKSTVKTGLSTSGLSFCPYQNTAVLILDNTNGLYAWTGSGTATVANAAIKGTSIAYWQGYVWAASGLTVTWSAPNSYTDWTAASGGGNIIISDQYLEGSLQAMVPTADILYLVGNGAVIAFSSLSISTANITTFQVTNISQVSGISDLHAVTPFKSAMLLANAHGVETYYGFANQKVSQPMDVWFSNIDLTKTIDIALSTIYNQLCVCVLCYYKPTATWYLASFIDKGWFLVNYGTLSLLTWIAANGSPQGYATNGTTIYSLFTDTATAIAGHWTSAFNDGGDPTAYKSVYKIGVEVNIPDATVTGTSVTFSSDSETGSNPIQSFANIGNGYNWLRSNAEQYGQYFGITCQFTLANATFEGMMMQYALSKSWP